MAVLFVNVWLISVYITPVILLLLILMPRFGRRFTSKLRCFVWMLVTARLLLPVHFSWRSLFRSNLPIANLLDRIDQTAVVEALQKIISDGGAETFGQASVVPAINWEQLGVIWLLGVGVFLCVNLIGYYITVKRLERWSTAVTNPFLLKIFEDTKARLGIVKNICLFQTSHTNSPLLVGLFRPRIYLPARQMSASELSDVISHELCHYKRGDLWFKLALLLSNAVHWFNPMVYFMMPQAELELEKACDSEVLRGANAAMRKQYGLSILSFVEKTQPLPTSLTTYFYGGKKQMKSRFSDMVNHNQKKSGIIFLATFTLLIVFCGVWANHDVFAASAEQAVGSGHSETGSLPENRGTGEMAWPVPGFYQITSGYGARYDGTDFHMGIDISGKDVHGASVIAAGNGKISYVSADWNSGAGYGMYVVIDHGDGVSTLYGHLSEILVNVGDDVEKGQAIAKVGSTGYATGPNLHFEVRENGATVDPVPYLAAATSPNQAE